MAPKKKRASQSKAPSKKTAARSKAKSKKNKSVSKIAVAKQSLQTRLNQVNRVINRLEGDVETVLKKIVKQSERSRKDLRKNFDDIVKKIRKGKIIARANETREELEKEVRRVAEEVIDTVKDLEAVLNSKKVAGVFENARGKFADLIELLAENGLVLQAKHSAAKTRKEILGLFSIPTQGDVEKLEKKIVSLEKRLSNLARKAA